jgi:cysteine synthase A
MKILGSILEAIGNTPLVRLNQVTKGINASVLVKCEYLNPSGSIKDRIALRMIEEAEKAGKVKAGSTIVDSSTGNTAIALSFVSAVKRLHSKMCMPKGWVSGDRRKIIEAYGAEIVEVAAGKEIEEELQGKAVHGGVIEILPRRKALEFESNDPEHTWYARQAMNPDNIAAHREGTGKEIIEQTDGKVDAFVGALGTGGTLLGVAEALKAVNPPVKIYGVEPITSSLFKMAPEIKQYMKKYSIPGVEGWIIEEIAKRQIVDDIFLVGDEDALEMANHLCQEEGLFCGISGGANVFISIKIAEKMKKGEQVVTILPDNRYRYFNSEHFTT